MVHQPHRPLVLEVRRAAHAADDGDGAAPRRRSPRAGRRRCRPPPSGTSAKTLARQRDPLVLREQRRLLVVHQDRDDDAVEQRRGAPHEIDVSDRQRVERPGAHGHAAFRMIASRPWRSGSARRRAGVGLPLGPAIEAERAAPRRHLARARQAPRFRGSAAPSRVLEHQHAIGRDSTGARSASAPSGFISYGGSRKMRSKSTSNGRGTLAVQIQPDDSIAARDTAVREVSANQLERARVAIRKGHVRCAAAEGFDADGAGAGTARRARARRGRSRRGC